MTGLSRRIESAIEPTLQALRTVPTLAWAPLLLLWLGIDEPPKVTLVAIGAFFPVYVNLVAGITGVDRSWSRSRACSARELRDRSAGDPPAALPELLTGLRLGATQAWLFVVVAEFFGSARGLGFRLTDSQQSTRVDLMFVAIVGARDPGEAHGHRDPRGRAARPPLARHTWRGAHMSRPLVVRELRKRYGDLPVLGGSTSTSRRARSSGSSGPPAAGVDAPSYRGGARHALPRRDPVGDQLVCGPHPPSASFSRSRGSSRGSTSRATSGLACATTMP